MVQTVNTEADKAGDIARDAITRIMPAKQGLSAVPDVGKITMGVSNIASDFLAIFSRNIEAYSRAQQIIINGNKNVLDKRVDVFTSTLWHAMTSAQEIMLQHDIHLKVQKIFDVVRSNMQENTGNNNIIAEMNARSNAEAAQIVQSRTFEVLDEMQALFKKMLDASPVASSGRAL
jgi:activator of HSP90 ATPase